MKLRRLTRLAWLRQYGPAVVLLLSLATLWQLVVTLGHVSPTVTPSPWDVLTATFDDRATVLPALGTTTIEAAGGLVLATLVAFAAAFAIDWSPVIRRSVYPLMVVSQTLPIIALAPLVVVYFGFGLTPKIFLVALFSFFPITVGLVQGLASADVEAMSVVRTMRASKVQLWRYVRLPGALPQFFTGVRISVTYVFSAAIVAEYVGAAQGLGVYLNSAAQAAPRRTDLVFGATLVTALVTIAVFVLVGTLERLVAPWQRPTGL